MYGLKQGNSIDFRVKARNLVGWSSFSQLSSLSLGTASMAKAPHKPASPPTRDDLLTSDLQLVVELQDLVGLSSGGDPVTSYNV